MIGGLHLRSVVFYDTVTVPRGPKIASIMQMTWVFITQLHMMTWALCMGRAS